MGESSEGEEEIGDWERAGLRRKVSLVGTVGVVRWHWGMADPWKLICDESGWVALELKLLTGAERYDVQLDEVTQGLMMKRRKGDPRGQTTSKRTSGLRSGQESGQSARDESSDGGTGIRTTRHRQL